MTQKNISMAIGAIITALVIYLAMTGQGDKVDAIKDGLGDANAINAEVQKLLPVTDAE